MIGGMNPLFLIANIILSVIRVVGNYFQNRGNGSEERPAANPTSNANDAVYVIVIVVVLMLLSFFVHFWCVCCVRGCLMGNVLMRTNSGDYICYEVDELKKR